MDPRDRWLDSALQRYPLAELPDGFVARTMARIAPVAQPELISDRPSPNGRAGFRWVGLVWPGLILLGTSWIVALGARSLAMSDPNWWQQWQLQLAVAWPGVAGLGFSLSTVGLALCTGVLAFYGLLVTWLWDRPQLASR